ncbi:MAG: MBL fold metallo-hydrolase [Candidatus Omnitrophica bacterium]|nr:MBL fold metallo-hydrolase [Candidatus Omnitrophota bacterium]
MILETITVGVMDTNCYVLAAAKNSEALIIDPGAEERKIRRVLEKHKLRPAFIINTHGHYDHIGVDDKFGVPVYVHKDDLALLRDPLLNLSGLFAMPYTVKSEIRILEDNLSIELVGLELKVLHIPGHTRGGIALLLKKPVERVVFTGDTLFCQGIGRSDLEGGNEALLIKSIREKLLTLPDETKIYPGHGPSSTIGVEKKNNPFFN